MKPEMQTIMKNNSSSRVKDALAILKESTEEFTLSEKPKRKVAKKAPQTKAVKKRPSK
jgi:hypothetical protein